MHSEKFDTLGRMVSPREVPSGSLMIDGSGYLRRVESPIHATACGDSEARLITEVAGGSEWGLVSSPTHEQVLPEHQLIHKNTEPGVEISGLDAEDRPLVWAETNRPDYWNNTWEWFTIGSEQALEPSQVTFPIRVWNIDSGSAKR